MYNPSRNSLLPCNPLRSVPRDIYLWSCPVLSSARALLGHIYSTYLLFTIYTPLYIQYIIYSPPPPPPIHTFNNPFYFQPLQTLVPSLICRYNVYSQTDVFIHAM